MGRIIGLTFEDEGAAHAAPSLESLKKDELVALAAERGVEVTGTKAEIIAALEAAAEVDPEAPEDPDDETDA